ncbi:MAG: hypothetical protein WC836_15110 [Desulfobacula sp.]|jgi:hypothetical protein
MNGEIKIRVCNPSIPPGSVRLQDTALLCQGLYDVVSSLIQLELGFTDSSKLREETKRLTSIVLTGVEEGSGVLCHETLPVEGITGTHPAIYATTKVVDAINNFKTNYEWPKTFPARLRNKWAYAIDSSVNENCTISLSVNENGSDYSCELDYPTKLALQELETFKTDIPVECIGKIDEINMDNKSFRIDTGDRRIRVDFADEQKNKVDTLRWKRVSISGYPLDIKCRRIGNLIHIREALEEENDYITAIDESTMPELLPGYEKVEERISEFSTYKSQWDSYNAKPPNNKILKFALNFYRDICSVLMLHEIDIPETFVVPTTSGGVQFEWTVKERELEIELSGVDKYSCLVTDGENELEGEGEVSRWNAIRLIMWVATGDDI